MFCGVVERTGFLHSSSMTLYCALENTHDHVQSNQRKDVNGAIYSWAYRLGPVSPMGGSTLPAQGASVSFSKLMENWRVPCLLLLNIEDQDKDSRFFTGERTEALPSLRLYSTDPGGFAFASSFY